MLKCKNCWCDAYSIQENDILKTIDKINFNNKSYDENILKFFIRENKIGLLNREYIDTQINSIDSLLKCMRVSLKKQLSGLVFHYLKLGFLKNCNKLKIKK